MRQILKTIILALSVALTALSCTKQENVTSDDTQDAAYLKINSVSTSQLKSVITGTAFPTDEKVSIGLFVTGVGYDEYSNIEYTKAAGSDKWTGQQIKLTDQVATIYAYYPYDASIENIEGIKVTSSFDGKDFMWSTPVEGVTAANPDIDLSFHHALALVEIIFNIYGYDHESAKLTYLKIESTEEGFAAWGTLNATNGSLSSGEVDVLSTDNEYSVSNGKIVVPCLLVPINADTYANPPRDFKVTCTFFGKTLSASLTGDKGVVIKQGVKSTISLNIKNGNDKMEVEDVGVDSWSDSNVSGNTVTAGGHTVTFNCPEGLKYEMNVEIETSTVLGESTEGNQKASVIFRYDKNSIPDDRFVVGNTIPGCTLSLDEQNGIVTVTDITDDVTVDIFGTYIRYIATSKIVPYKKDAFGAPYDEPRSTYSNGSGVVAIDGTVTSIGKQAFMNSSIMRISLPKELQTIGENAFDGCNYLTNINLQECDKLKTIGIEAFYGMGSKAESGAFALVLPEGLEEIGGSAFGAAYITSVTLPSTLEKIDYTGFYNCVTLKTITSKASTPPTLGNNVFHHPIYVPSVSIVPMDNIETIYVPAGSVDNYKSAEGWSVFSSKITAIQ